MTDATEGPRDSVAQEADTRTLEIRERLAAVRARIATACRAAGRSSEPPQLIVVTKFHPAADIRRLAALGITDVGENRDQEASEKAGQLRDLDLRWHFVGQLQSNKAKSVVRYAHAIHSVDREQLATALGRAMAVERERTGRGPLECFIQVSLDEEAAGHRGGATASQVLPLAARLSGSEGLGLAGVMAVAPLGWDPDRAFEKLAEISARLKVEYPSATAISAGMSQDLEAAIRAGATHLRIGSDILGSRPAVR
ncbi:MAG: YggS family pyridoxal phosphate-dependent enzyme [Arthrobacter sp.]